MNYWYIINIISNLVIFIAMLLFTLLCFGRKNSRIYKFGVVQAFILKIALTAVCVSSLSNVCFVDDPPISEIIHNIGFAFLFIWAAFFHYTAFVKPKIKQKKRK